MPDVSRRATNCKRWDREIVWHAFTQMAEYEPLIIERAHGCTLVDIDGREYLDGVSSLWCNVHGHRHPRLDAAMREQLGRVAHVTPLGASNPTTIELARRLVELAPPGLKHVFFSDDGATAVEVALKMAFQYWRQRQRAAAGEDELPGARRRLPRRHAGQRQRRRRRPVSRDVPAAAVRRAAAAGAGHVSPAAGRDREQRCSTISGSSSALLASEHQRIAALVIEPLVQAAAGMVVHPPGYLRGVRELTRQYDVLLIADEVAVGFGRTGHDVRLRARRRDARLSLPGQGADRRLPAAGRDADDRRSLAGLPRRLRRVETFFHGHTYGGNPLGAAVALAIARRV